MYLQSLNYKNNSAINWHHNKEMVKKQTCFLHISSYSVYLILSNKFEIKGLNNVDILIQKRLRKFHQKYFLTTAIKTVLKLHFLIS